jgi:hypothetical protein
MTPVGDQGSHLLYIPDVVLVSEAFHRFTSFRIAPVSQLAVAMNGVVAAALQFITNGSLAGAGKGLRSDNSSCPCPGEYSSELWPSVTCTELDRGVRRHRTPPVRALHIRITWARASDLNAVPPRRFGGWDAPLRLRASRERNE